MTTQNTRTYFRDAEGRERWAITLITEPHGYAWYTVTHDGWVVLELKCRELRTNESGAFATDCFATGKARETIPDYVMSHLPQVTTDK